MGHPVMSYIYIQEMMVVGHKTKKVLHRTRSNYLFDLDIEDQGHTDLIFICDIPACPNTYTYKV